MNLFSLSDIFAGMALILSIIMSIYNIKLNRKIYAPKVDFLFEEIPYHTAKGETIYKSSMRYNIIMVNSSDYHLYDFKVTCTFYGLENKEAIKEIGFLNTPLATFVRGQQYISYFESMKELRDEGCTEILFDVQYKLHPKKKKVYRESVRISVLGFKNCRLVLEEKRG